MKRLMLMAAVFLVASGSLLGQGSTADPLTATVRRTLNEYSKDLVAAAEEMPAEKFSYAPTKEQMSFGKSIAHVAEVNNFACAKVSDVPAAAGPKLTEADSKEKLVAGLKASMDYCARAFAKLADAKLAETVPFYGGRTSTRLGAALEVNNDLIDHYAALAVYLRLNGLLPPTAQKKQ